MKKVQEVETVSEINEVAPSSEVLTQDQALNILVNAAKLATKRGAFEIEVTEFILKAIKIFLPKQ